MSFSFQIKNNISITNHVTMVILALTKQHYGIKIEVEVENITHPKHRLVL